MSGANGDVQLPLLTLGTFSCNLKNCCSQQFLSQWEGGGRDEHRCFGGKDVEGYE